MPRSSPSAKSSYEDSLLRTAGSLLGAGGFLFLKPGRVSTKTYKLASQGRLGSLRPEKMMYMGSCMTGERKRQPASISPKLALLYWGVFLLALLFWVIIPDLQPPLALFLPFGGLGVLLTVLALKNR